VTQTTYTGRSLVPGLAHGELLVTQTPLSFWGGVDPQTGIVIDEHHPLKGQCLSGRVLALPASRGSCSGSGVMLELMLSGVAPAGLVCCEAEEILTLGAIIADEMFERSLPVLQIAQLDFESLSGDQHASIQGQQLVLQSGESSAAKSETPPTDKDASIEPIHLTPDDNLMLSGQAGRAAQLAMQVLLRMAQIQRAEALVDVTQVHIDACIYSGPSSLLFAQKLLEWVANVRVPTTLNAISVDQQQWRALGVKPSLGLPASELADTYMAMGASESFTCAPYQLESAPARGENIGWAESNAVVYANSVIGARTQKYADFLDVCIALTGRAPSAGAHLSAGRSASLIIDVEAAATVDDAFWPLLGLQVGELAAHHIPIVCGLGHLAPTNDDLKAFSAAFATTSSAAMFHLQDITPEADLRSALNAQRLSVSSRELLAVRERINTASDEAIDLICLGNPHFSAAECAKLAQLCEGKNKREGIDVLVTLSRYVYDKAMAAGHIAALEHFGVRFIRDTCWCMLGAPIVPESTHAVMTNSGKFAHYAPGLINRPVYFGSLTECVNAASQ